MLHGRQSRDDAVDVRQSRDDDARDARLVVVVDDALRSDGFLVRGHDAREKVPGRVRLDVAQQLGVGRATVVHLERGGGDAPARGVEADEQRIRRLQLVPQYAALLRRAALVGRRRVKW